MRSGGSASALLFCSEPPPGIRHKEHQHGEDLQTARQHVKNHNQLGGIGVAAKVHHGAHLGKAGADVVQRGGNGGEVGHHVKAIQTDEEEGCRKDEDVGGHKDIGGADGLMVDHLAVHPDRGHHLRVKGLLELLAHSLAHQQEAADLYAAAGAACAGTHKHQHDKDLLGEGGPQVKITAGKTGGGDDRTHLEGGVAQGLAQAVVHAVNVGRDDDHSHTDDHKVGAHLLAGGSAAEAPHQQQEIGIEVHAKQDHKDGHNTTE